VEITREAGVAGTYTSGHAPGDDPWTRLAHTADHIAKIAGAARTVAVDTK